MLLVSGICEQVDVVFLLDVSGSMIEAPLQENTFDATLDFVQNMISAFNIGPEYTQVSVVLLGNTGTILSKTNTGQCFEEKMHSRIV